MKIIETGMTVRLLIDDETGGPQIAGMLGLVERKESTHDDTPIYWVLTTNRKRVDGQTIHDRAPYFAEELEPIAGSN